MLSRGQSAGIDADLLVKVSSMPRDHGVCRDTIAFAVPSVFEKYTRRPIFDTIWVCHFGQDDFATDLGTMMHELGHIIVRSDLLCRRRFATHNTFSDQFALMCIHVPLRRRNCVF